MLLGGREDRWIPMKEETKDGNPTSLEETHVENQQKRISVEAGTKVKSWSSPKETLNVDEGQMISYYIEGEKVTVWSNCTSFENSA